MLWKIKTSFRQEENIFILFTHTHTHTRVRARMYAVHAQLLSLVRLSVAHPAPLSMEFSRQEYWSGLLFPTSGDLPTQGSNPCLLHLLTGRWILYHCTT